MIVFAQTSPDTGAGAPAISAPSASDPGPDGFVASLPAITPQKTVRPSTKPLQVTATKKRGRPKARINWDAEISTHAYADPDVAEEIASCLPKSETRRVLAYLITASVRSFRSGNTLLGRATVQDLMQHWERKFTLKKALEQLASQGLLIELEEHSGHTSKVTEVNDFVIKDHPELIGKLLNPSRPLCERVNLVNGQYFDPSETNRLREAAILGASSQAHCDDARWIVETLNTTNPHFEGVREFVPYLLDYSSRINEDSPEAFLHDQKTLRQCEALPQPIYRPVPHTVRIFSNGFNRLSRPVRRELSRQMGWETLDLKHFQLAVVAELWGCQKLSAFLATGGSYWKTIQLHIDLQDDAESTTRKDVVKKATYAAIFGAGERRILEIFTDAGYAKHGKAFLAHPWIVEILVARQARFEQIRNSALQASTDAYGNAWPYKESGLKSVACAEIQSYEVAVIVPALRDSTVKFGPAMTITSFLHDGFAIMTPGNMKELIVGYLYERVSANLKAFGFQSELEIG
jgi:hypothetical protein